MHLSDFFGYWIGTFPIRRQSGLDSPRCPEILEYSLDPGRKFKGTEFIFGKR